MTGSAKQSMAATKRKNGLLRSARNDVTDLGCRAASQRVVMLRGVSSTQRLLDCIIGASEYWIARRSLSSGGAMRRPGGGRRRLRVWRTHIHQTRARDLAARCARVVHLALAPFEGVGNAGCPLHPRPRAHFVLVERTRVTTSTPERPAFPHAMVLRLMSRSPR
jgi:hypothetical protein